MSESFNDAAGDHNAAAMPEQGAVGRDVNALVEHDTAPAAVDGATGADQAANSAKDPNAAALNAAPASDAAAELPPASAAAAGAKQVESDDAIEPVDGAGGNGTPDSGEAAANANSPTSNDNSPGSDQPLPTSNPADCADRDISVVEVPWHRAADAAADCGCPAAPPMREIWYERGHLAQDRRDVLEAMRQSGMPFYVHNGRLGVLVDPGFEQTDAGLRFQVLATLQLKVYLSEFAVFRVERANGDAAEIDAPDAVLKAVLGIPPWPFPTLRAIERIPILLPNGRLIDVAGFDADSGIYYDPPADLDVTAIPEWPTRADARDAVAVLSEAVVDARFAAPCDCAAALSAIMTTVLRRGIDGCTPIVVLTSAKSRIGKTEIAQIASIVRNGEPAVVQAPPTGREIAKEILAQVRAGAHIVVWDNADEEIGGAALEAAATARKWQGRVLCTSDMYTGEMNLVVFITGRHVSYHLDMLGRIAPVELATDVEDLSTLPMHHHDVRAWVRANRGRLLAAILTIARAYFVAGSPDVGLAPLRGYDEWNRVVRSALVWAGTADPLQKLAQLKADADPETEACSQALEALETMFPSGRHFTANTLLALLERPQRFGVAQDVAARFVEGFQIVVGATPEQLGPLMMGHKLKRLSGQTLNGRILRSLGSGYHGREYRVDTMRVPKVA